MQREREREGGKGRGGMRGRKEREGGEGREVRGEGRKNGGREIEAAIHYA